MPVRADAGKSTGVGSPQADHRLPVARLVALTGPSSRVSQSMSLQWFPGHMTRARRELAALMPSQDIVIEVLDARLPRASSNPVLSELRRGKPAIKVLTKSDLADPEVTRAWLAHFAAEPNVTAFASTTDTPTATRTRIAALTRGFADHRGKDKPVRALIAGVPNVGKSTLI